MILIVDDDPDTRRMLTALFDTEARQCIAVASVSAAIIVLVGQTPELVILDYNMPGMTGHDLLQTMRSFPSWQHIPVMMYTASDSIDLKALSMRLGAQAHLVKPTRDWDAFINKVNQLAVLPAA